MGDTGGVAEWLGRGLQNLVHRFNSGPRLQGSISADGRRAWLALANHKEMASALATLRRCGITGPMARWAQGSNSSDGGTMTLAVESESIRVGEPIPELYAVATPTADGKSEIAGADRSPHMRWSGEPQGTRSFAISVVDPDVPADRTRMGVEGLVLGEDEPRVDFAHWLVVDVPPDTHEVPEGADSEGFVAHGKAPGQASFGGVTGQNGFTGLFEGNPDLEGVYGGWDGPFSPWNDDVAHRYFFTVYALDVESLGLGSDFTLEEFRQAIQGHVLDTGEFVATYTLNPKLR
jgi:Raf kinase inhibitor-like YbhB/YbcL family protein